jgi:CBS domain-containing protein
MLIADILREKGAHVQTTTAETLLKDAIKLLASQRIGALLVSGNGRSIDGILSERDIVRGLANDAIDFSSNTVGDLMTSNVCTCGPEATVSAVMALMDEKRIRHVPVTVNNVLAGVVSIRDIVNARLKEAEMERKELANYIAGSPTAV